MGWWGYPLMYRSCDQVPLNLIKKRWPITIFHVRSNRILSNRGLGQVILYKHQKRWIKQSCRLEEEMLLILNCFLTRIVELNGLVCISACLWLGCLNHPVVVAETLHRGLKMDCDVPCCIKCWMVKKKVMIVCERAYQSHCVSVGDWCRNEELMRRLFDKLLRILNSNE